MTIGVHALRVLTRTNIHSVRLRAGGGPALVYIGGDASGLGKRSYGGASLVTDLTVPAGRFRCRIGLEDAIYRVTLASRPPSTGDTVSTPMQHDLLLTLGFSFPLR